MRKLYLSLLCFFSFAVLVQAQPYHNEWIPFATGQSYSSQQYYRIAIWKEGIYRATYNDLLNKGVPVTTWFNPLRYQIFNKGKEQFIQVVDVNTDNIFDAGDYIEFYGKGNDGLLDAEIYDFPTSQPNINASLFNDTASYFLTYNPFSLSNRRMPIESDINYAGYTPEPYAIHTDIKNYFDNYNIGYRDGNNVGDNPYTVGEGYYSSGAAKGSPIGYTFTTQNYLPSGPAPSAEITLIGANRNPHPYDVRSGTDVLINNLIYGYQLARHGLSPINLPINGAYPISLVPLDDGDPNNANYMQIAYIKLSYPRSLDFASETFPQSFSINASGVKAYLELSNTTLSNPLMYVMTGDTVKYVLLNQTTQPLRTLITSNGSSQTCYMLDNSQVFSMANNATITTVNNNPDPNINSRFTNFLTAGANKDFLIVSNKLLWNGATSYANYRTLSGHPSLLADVDELYDQFAWGIHKDPLAIRKFADFMIDNFDSVPKYLLLIGKSVTSMDARSGYNNSINLVPTFGEPPSDQMFTAKLNTSEYKQELATGRISAWDEADVTAYLNKLISFELQQKQPPALWMKNVLHFGGGSNINEQDYLSSFLTVYKNIIEDTLFGGKVTTFLKSSTSPIQINQSQYLQQLIDSGCSMMTFFGHAAGSSFDVATDIPENYHNKDRYPLVLANSCYVGNIHTSARQLNERFVLSPDKGAIAFLAVPDVGIPEVLSDYSEKFHRVLFQEEYGTSVGECMKSTVAQIITPDFARRGVCMNMTLHGDPAIVLNSYSKPDYFVQNSNIIFEPANITTELDSFTVKVAISNIGKNTNQTMNVLISRTFPDHVTKKDTIFHVPYISYSDTVSIKLPVDFKNGSGINDFLVTVDVYDEVDEIDNFINNNARAQLIINSTDINPVYPQKYSIIPNGTLSLKATTADLFAKAKTYRFELDTTPFFNSPKLQIGTVANAFGIVSWTATSTLDSNIAYFWRVGNDSIMNPDTSISKKYQWRNSSFMYKPNITGWSQAHFYQFQESNLTNVVLNNSNRVFDFILSNYALDMTHIENRPSYDINGINMDYGGCTGAPQLAIAVLDSIDFTNPWTSDSCIHFFGNYNYYSCNTNIGQCRQRPDRYFLFNTADSIQNADLVDMINNKVPSGDYILAWTVFPVNFASLPSSVNNAFVQLGASAFPNLTISDKFMMFSHKGFPSQTIFKQGHYPDSILNINYSFVRNWDKGFIESTVVGPAKKWTTFHWDYRHLEPVNSPDSIALQIIGITPNKLEVVLVDNIFTTADIDISTIDALQYPNLKIKAFVQDSVFRTPAQLNRWQVYYEPVPEGALNTRYYSFYKDSIQEGDQVKLDMAFENISSVKMDTLLVDYFIYDANNIRHSLGSVRMKRDLPPGDTVMTHLSFSSAGYAGLNNLWIEANPHQDQPEQYHFNNLANLHFNVSKDITNPLLDVTFDGLHILNGDIVSSKPNIHIQLMDENKYIVLNDTADFRVSLINPSGASRYLNFEPTSGSSSDNAKLKWTPATLPSNSFKIDYSPFLTQDGVYTLDVQATDKSGNLSGQNDFRIQFEVINRSTITEVINYPNPFSTSTRFVFVLTGSETPSEFKIQIMTVTGKIIREITKDELGPLHIGRNLTDYAWNGKDEFGDQLANGVYLYHVVTKIDGNKIENRDVGIDKYFKRGWGKMYLMR